MKTLRYIAPAAGAGNPGPPRGQRRHLRVDGGDAGRSDPPSGGATGPTPETVALIRDRYGLDDPILSQYFTYLKNLIAGDMGASLRYRVPVTQLIAQHYPVTLFLVVYTIVLTLPPVIALSVWSARRQNGPADQIIRLIGVLGLAIPVFWLALLFRAVLRHYAGLVPGQRLRRHRARALPAPVSAGALDDDLGWCRSWCATCVRRSSTR